MLVPVEVSAFAIDPNRAAPLAVLKEIGGGGRSVAVPLEHGEANIIAMHSLQVSADKPFTVDLVKIVIEQLGAVLYRAVINDIADGVFSACIIVRAAAALQVINCRPGDAVTLAMKCGAPIFVKEDVFFKISAGRGQSEAEQLRAHIKSVDVTEFGKYILE